MSEPLQGSSKIAASDIALGLLLGIAFSCFYFSIAQDYRTFAGYTVYDNVLFGADHVDALEGWIGKHKGTHPLLPLIVVPLSNLFQSLCGSYELGLAAMSGCIGGLAVLLFYALTRMLVERIPSVLLATLFGVSMNQMVFSGLPDTYVLVAISVMPSFMLLIHDLRHSTVSRRLWIAAGVFRIRHHHYNSGSDDAPPRRGTCFSVLHKATGIDQCFTHRPYVARTRHSTGLPPT